MHLLDDLLNGLDDLVDGDDASTTALVPFDDASHAVAPHTHLGAPLHGSHEPLVLPPGADCHAHYLSLPDPLSGMSGYGFEAYSFDHQSGLVDLDGDGVMDHTCWGTRVVQVEPYMRADGTWVEGHYRTVPDGVTWNNLSRLR